MTWKNKLRCTLANQVSMHPATPTSKFTCGRFMTPSNPIPPPFGAPCQPLRVLDLYIFVPHFNFSAFLYLELGGFDGWVGMSGGCAEKLINCARYLAPFLFSPTLCLLSSSALLPIYSLLPFKFFLPRLLAFFIYFILFFVFRFLQFSICGLRSLKLSAWVGAKKIQFLRLPKRGRGHVSVCVCVCVVFVCASVHTHDCTISPFKRRG